MNAEEKLELTKKVVRSLRKVYDILILVHPIRKECELIYYRLLLLLYSHKSLFFIEPSSGLEPPTSNLRSLHSTIELTRHTFLGVQRYIKNLIIKH